MNDRLPSNHGGGSGRRALASLLVLLAAVPAYPAQLELKTGGPAAAAPQVVVKDNVVELSLEQVVELALSQNLGIVLQRYSRQQAALGIYQALGIYDLLATADLTASDSKILSSNPFAPRSTKQEALSFGLSQLLPTGGVLGVTGNNTRTEQVFGVPTTSLLNPSYNSDVNVSYSQPLLRNFGRLATERQLLIARSNSAVSRQEFERQATLILQQAIDAYWNLVEARAQLGVAQESLGLAKELHERNRVQVQVGTMAPLELVQSEAQIATNEENIITAQANLANAADALRQLVNLPNGDIWDKEIRPVTDAQTEHIAINLADAIKAAFDRRPDIRSQQIAVERFRNDAEFFRGQKKPQLDLSVAYGLSGQESSFSRANSQVTGFDFPGWSGRLHLAIPIQNRAARAQSVIADIDYERAKVQLDSLRSQVFTEVRTAARGVDTAAKQIDAARASRGFQEKNLEAERKKYENGMSTSFEITRIQSDLTLARSREVSAVVQYRRALVEYYRATGRLLDTQGIVVADDEPPVNRFSFHNGAIEAYEPNRQAPAVVKEGQPNTPAQPGSQPAPPAPPANPNPPGQGNGSHGGQ
jgi:outer membrane protein TolC